MRAELDRLTRCPGTIAHLCSDRHGKVAKTCWLWAPTTRCPLANVRDVGKGPGRVPGSGRYATRGRAGRPPPASAPPPTPTQPERT